MNSGVFMIVNHRKENFTKWCKNPNEVLKTIKTISLLEPSFDPKEDMRLIIGTEAFVISHDDGLNISTSLEDVKVKWSKP